MRRSRDFAPAGRCDPSQKRAELGQVPPVRLVLDFLWRLEQLRDAPEARVGDDGAEGLRADASLADVLVAVDARAERLLRVVEGERADFADADVRVDLVDDALPSAARADVVAGGEDVAGVDADADALLFVDEVYDPAELLERAAEAGALPRGGLEERDDLVPRQARMHVVERARDLVGAGGDARAEVRAGMEDDGVDAEALGAVELVGHRLERVAVDLRVRRGEVDEVRRVGEDRLDVAQLREERDVVVGHCLALPLTRVLGEERDGGGVDQRGTLEDGVQAALRGDVRADEVAMFFVEAETGHRTRRRTRPAQNEIAMSFVPSTESERESPELSVTK